MFASNKQSARWIFELFVKVCFFFLIQDGQNVFRVFASNKQSARWIFELFVKVCFFFKYKMGKMFSGCLPVTSRVQDGY